MRTHARFVSGWARTAGSEIEAGLAMMEAEYLRASAVGPLFRFYAMLLADARERSGRLLEALDFVNWALGTVTEPGVGIFVSELHRLRGVCLLRLGLGNEAEAMRSLLVALEVEKQQGAALLQLRAALSIAHASGARGHSAAALALVRAACADLPAECDLAELGEAKPLLAA